MDPRYQSKARAKLPEEDVFVTVSLRVSRAMRDDMEAQARWRGVSRSEYMRELLDAGMARTARAMARDAHAERLRAPQSAVVPPRGGAGPGIAGSGPQNGSHGLREGRKACENQREENHGREDHGPRRGGARGTVRERPFPGEARRYDRH